MAQNPLLGKRISLISKKNIRYEGLLYSINEQNATVALQNVRSYGTEGRELTDPETTLVAPTLDAVHPYLVFRGQDIKDLHVHESQTAAADEAKTAKDTPAARSIAPAVATTAGVVESTPPKPHAQSTPEPTQQHQQQQGGRGSSSSGGNRRQRKPNNAAAAVGTGASLLSRKERGTVVSDNAESAESSKADFDFQSHNDQFAKETAAEDDEAGDEPVNESGYDKDDFFDSISCDALDKQSGVDNRLRGQQERQLNTETFGATALNNNRRRGRGGGRGHRGGGSGRYNSSGSGRDGGRGSSRGRGGRGRGRGSAGRNSSGAGAQQSRYASES